VLLAFAVDCRKPSETLPAGATKAGVVAQFPLAGLRARLKITISAEAERVEAPEPPAG